MLRQTTVLTAFLALFITSGASATGNIECHSEDSDVSLGLTIGSLPILAVVGADIQAAGQSWNTRSHMVDAQDKSEAIAIMTGQAFQTSDTIQIDFTDPNVEHILAEVRLFSASEDMQSAMGGTLKINGVGVWAITCIGP